MRIKNIFGSDGCYLSPIDDVPKVIRLQEKRITMLELVLSVLLSDASSLSLKGMREVVKKQAEEISENWEHLK